MANIRRTLAELIALYADNTVGGISEQDGRDFIVTTFPNISATAPTVNDDSVDGYCAGSFWCHTVTTSTTVYQCADPTVGAAIWNKIGEKKDRYGHDLVFNAVNPAIVNDGSLVIDYEYKIVSVGTSNFTKIGAAENTVGIIFTATGANAGGNGTVNVTDNNTVYWSSGDIKLSDRTIYNIDAGNTGNMAAITYIFLDTAVSETVLQLTTTAANAIGANRILIAVAQNVALKGCALFQVFSGKSLGGLGKRINDSDIDTVSIVKDKTPQLGGELDAQAHSIGFTQQSATGDGATNIDWKLGNKFKFTFGAMNETFTFTAPTKPCNLLLMLVQDGVGSRTATFPATVKWNNNTAPTLSTAAAAVDIVSMYWDETSYFCAANLNFL